MTQAPFPMPGPQPGQSSGPGPSLRWSVGLIVVGVVIGIISVIAIVVPLAGTFTSSELFAPAHLSMHLRHARYTVYERSGSRSGFVTHAGVVTIDPSQVLVTAPNGEPVPVSEDTNVETVTRGSTVFTGAVQFEAPVSGQYDIRLSTRVTEVVIARSLNDAIRSVLVWFGTAAIGGILFIVGVVMLIVGSTRRGRARRVGPAGYGPMGYGPMGYGQPGGGWGAPPPYGQPPPPPPPPSGPAPDDPWAPPPG